MLPTDISSVAAYIAALQDFNEKLHSEITQLKAELSRLNRENMDFYTKMCILTLEMNRTTSSMQACLNGVVVSTAGV